MSSDGVVVPAEVLDEAEETLQRLAPASPGFPSDFNVAVLKALGLDASNVVEFTIHSDGDTTDVELTIVPQQYGDPDVVKQVRVVDVDEYDRLLRWRDEAIEVLGQWEQVWDAAGRPGPLGASKPESVRDFILSRLP